MTLFNYEIIKTKHILIWRNHLFLIAIFSVHIREYLFIVFNYHSMTIRKCVIA